MPRRSAADLGVVPAVEAPRPAPPRGMPSDEAKVWRATVEGLPPHWFPGASLVLLEVYVAAVVTMRTCRAIMLAEVEGTKAHQDASRLYHAEAATVLRLAKVLRLGPRHDRTKPKLVPTGPRPWEGDEEPPTRDSFAKEMAEVLAKVKPKPDGEDPTAA
jgi:hypothetical protein